MDKKLIDLYPTWKKLGRIPEPGLCHSVPKRYRETIRYFFPTDENFIQLRQEEKSTVYWGSGLSAWDYSRTDKFTPLREAITLFICAIHGEL